MGLGRRFVLLAATLATLVPVGALPVALAPAPGGPYALPHEAAFIGLMQTRTADGLFRHDEAGTVFFVADQMLGVLALVHRAGLFPSEAAERKEQALETWRATQTGWSETSRSYYVTLSAASVCVPMEANAWGLLASRALANATGDAVAAGRSQDLARTLQDTVSTHGFRAAERCPLSSDLPPSLWPLPMWALIEYGREARDEASRRAGMDRLAAELDARFDGSGYLDPSSLYLAAPNAQLLLALEGAASTDASFVEARDGLDVFLRTRILVASPRGLQARSLEVSGGTLRPLDTASAADQVWAAHALAQARRRGDGGVSDQPERILSALAGSFWQGEAGGFSNAAGPDPAVNALIALTTSSPRVTGASSDPPRIAFFVPATHGFTYPAIDATNASAYHLLNAWDLRFRLEGMPAQGGAVTIPTDAIAALRLFSRASPYTPTPTLSRAGSPIPMNLTPGSHGLITFRVPAGAAADDYRFTAYAPLMASYADVQRSARIIIDNGAGSTIPGVQVGLELAMSNVQVTGVRVNDRPLAATDFAVTELASTTALARRHVRVDLRGVDLRPGPTNEVVVSYIDAVAPTVGDPYVTRDMSGTDRAPTSQDDKTGAITHRLGSAGRGYVWAVAEDNGGLKAVTMALGEDPSPVLVPMTGVLGRPGVFVGALPTLAKNEPIRLRVVATDEHDNLHAAPTVALAFVEAETSFFREGSPILFAFSATLFVTAFVIFVKMGRGR